MPFPTHDWLSLGVRMLPPDVRGLWIDLLCYLWNSCERGVMVKDAGGPFTKEEIIDIIGKDMSGSGKWLEMLVESGYVSIREEDGAYYCPKIVRGVEISNKRREAGRKGGEVTKAKVFSKEVTTAPAPAKSKDKTKKEKEEKYKYAEFVALTHIEYEKLCIEYTEEAAKEMVDILNNYKGSTGKRYKSDYLTIRGWVKDKYYENLQKYGKKINGKPGGSAKQPGSATYTDTL